MNLKDGYKPRAQEFKLSKSKSNILDKMPIKSRDKPEPIQVKKFYHFTVEKIVKKAQEAFFLIFKV